MSKKKPFSKHMRINPDFEREMKELARVRLSKGLAKMNTKELGTAEMTRLLRKTDGYKISLKELQTKPRTED